MKFKGPHLYRATFNYPSSTIFTIFKLSYDCKTCLLCSSLNSMATNTSTLSHVAALRRCLHLQFVPQAHHLPRRLVMGCVIAFYTTVLAELEAMQIVYRFRPVKLLYPHSHTHIFHLEQLHQEEIKKHSAKTEFQTEGIQVLPLWKNREKSAI